MLIETVTRALADPTRLRMMRLLAHMELAVGELAQVLGQSQPRVSRHVGILCDSGLAERRREGSWTFLRQAASGSRGRGLGATVVRMLEAAEEEDASFGARCAEDRRHLAAIRTAREKGAADYFARHAGEWDQLRSWLSPAKTVEAALLESLGDAPLGRLLDIGTGTGRMAELLADRSDHVVAFDKSTEMLRLARARLQSFPPQQIELVQGDFGALPFGEGEFDTVVLHQVLHYAQEPAQPLAEAARVCRPGGRVVVVDLATHEREELRERHAHARLGFSDEQMLEWLTGSGFAPALPVALPGKGLTTKIWLGTRPPALKNTIQTVPTRARD
ncbi:metalloregulator ArsR/SmtB family transcription factor [Altererythrobacter soli]|uniref:Metalloregulator ArsR/SmtB family transcription factor n=1 Tax=Croceibacterium soli TaxID=1739690 RepID=A0A6I4UYD8_9SPHN|nr:metalloregulator ArsR/SmtB family transcription factor [Croceibacterium soli]MXP42603.1 metalloregulator ArsR/SmtB family transcription factor [Croceibacterium soli]